MSHAVDYSFFSKPIKLPTNALPLPEAKAQQVELFVRRLDLTDALISGNKFFKLKYTLEEALTQPKRPVLTFGGAYSNHLVAVAAACEKLGLPCIGVVRGERPPKLGPVLQFLEKSTMHLHFISRSAYREKDLAPLQAEFGDFFLVPEGGSNAAAVRGCTEILSDADGDFTHIALACGTGGTAAGLWQATHSRQEIRAFSVLKGGGFLQKEVQALTLSFQKKYSKKPPQGKFRLVTDYHFGGYAKKKPELLDFIDEMSRAYALPLDFVYTGKALFGLRAQIKAGEFPKGAKILFLHTGGLPAVG